MWGAKAASEAATRQAAEAVAGPDGGGSGLLHGAASQASPIACTAFLLRSISLIAAPTSRSSVCVLWMYHTPAAVSKDMPQNMAALRVFISQPWAEARGCEQARQRSVSRFSEPDLCRRTAAALITGAQRCGSTVARNSVVIKTLL